VVETQPDPVTIKRQLSFWGSVVRMVWDREKKSS